MNSAEKGAVLHCLKSMIDEAVCEECPLYGMTGTDHCEADCVRLAINALEQEVCDDEIKYFKIIYELSQTLGVSYDFIDEKIQKTVMSLKTKPLALSPVTPQPCADAISREAAIDLIEDFETKRLKGEIDLIYAPAIKGIKELPSVSVEKTELCTDAISRQAVIDICESHNGQGYVWSVIADEVRQLPSVVRENRTAEKVGQWIYDDDCREHGHCSECGYGSIDIVDGKPHNYCSNCGIKMEV